MGKVCIEMCYNRIYNSKKQMQFAILREFNKQGLSEQSEITEFEVKKALDSICFKNIGSPEFDNQVCRQIWNETRDNQERPGPIKLKDFIRTMIKAENILRQQIQLAQQQLKTDITIQNDPIRKDQLLNNLFSYSQDHKSITQPFRLQQIKQTKQIEQSKLRHSKKVNKSSFFSMNVDQRQESTDLKIVFVLTLVLLVIQLVVMFQKNHFFTILGVLIIAVAFVLNYFQKKFVMFLLGWTIVSFVLDLLWMIFNASAYWHNSSTNLRSNIQTGFLRFIVFMVCIEMILKILLFGLMFKYKGVGDNLKKKVNICGLTFLLDSQPDRNNLFVKAFSPAMQASNPFQQ